MKAPTKAELKAEVALWRDRACEIRSEYDVLRAGRLRRTPKRETTDESGVYTPAKRSLGSNVGRNLERNYAPARGFLQQFRANVVGSLGKLQVNAENGEAAAAWFNGEWAKECDFRDAQHWSAICQNVVAAVMREGDVLCVFDDDLVEDSGKLLFWESDQVLPCADAVFKERFPADYIQDNGIVRDRWGRVKAYLCTGKRGQASIDSRDDLTVWSSDNAILIRDPWRMNQGRGVPPLLTAAAPLQDLYEMLARELQTAKRAAADYAYVKRADSVDNWDTPGSMNDALAPEGGASEAKGEKVASTYDALEAFTGGNTDYAQPGDEIQFPTTNRPNVHLAEFSEAVLCHAGAAFGLARAYAMLKADTSYTAFRGDMIMTWQGAFLPMQKWLERSFADWVGRKALQWAMKTGAIRQLAPKWEKTLSWTWPRMPEVQANTAQEAIEKSIKNGVTNWAQEIGPDWRAKFRGLAEQLDYARKLNLPLAAFETKSGGTVS